MQHILSQETRSLTCEESPKSTFAQVVFYSQKSFESFFQIKGKKKKVKKSSRNQRTNLPKIQSRKYPMHNKSCLPFYLLKLYLFRCSSARLFQWTDYKR